MNMKQLEEANILRAKAYAANDCPLMHAAADSLMRRLVSEHNDAVMLKRAQARAEAQP